MRITTRRVLYFGVLLLLTALPSHAAELDVETYIQLSIERLELIETAWREAGESPPEEELKELYGSYGTDQETYFCFSGEKNGEIKVYLEENPDLRDTIESLSASIRRHIAEGEEE